LVHAKVLSIEQNLLAGVGLPTPDADPLVHGSAGVNTKLGWPMRADT
jgi:hypothetical protein